MTCFLPAFRIEFGVDAVGRPFHSLRFGISTSDSYGADVLSDGVVGADTATVRYHINHLAVLDTD